MTISVALCTYRGARFLGAQLDSIAAGTLWPDELVIFDDASRRDASGDDVSRDDVSGDDTVAIARDFAARAPFPVHIQEQPQNVGVSANFGAALSRCRSEILVLCDQDDVWHPLKLERLRDAFAAHPDAALVMSDARIIDQNGDSMGTTLWQQLGFEPPPQGKWGRGEWVESLAARPKVTGATMAFRREWKALVLPFEPAGPWIHDTWIALLCAGVAPAILLDEPLLDYRRHAEQQTAYAARGRSFEGQRRQTASQLDQQLAQLREIQRRWRQWQAADCARQLEARCRHLEKRLAFRRHRARCLFVAGRELLRGRYHLFSNGWRSFAADLLFRSP